MKKTYITPRTEVYTVACPQMLAASSVQQPIYEPNEIPEDENEEMW